MKKIVFLVSLIAVSLMIGSTVNIAYATESDVLTNAKGAYMIDYDSGTVIYAYNENERLPIASMTKIMTSLLVFEAIQDGKLNYDTQITVSENAANMGGSQVFLDANSVHSVENLLKSVVVASANDSSVALAESISGSEQAFTSLMNKRATELNMTNTNFSNCTGLPSVNSYSSAKDVSIMLKELLNHQKYYEFCKVWLEDYTHPDGRVTTITNTNKLIRFYNGCDAGKTGYTSEALFCLSASAKRGDMRIIATVVGDTNGKQRFADVSNMFNYAFAQYENKVLYAAGDSVSTVEVTRGKCKDIAIAPRGNICAFGKKGDETLVDVKFEIPKSVKAPFAAGDKLGKAIVIKEGVVIDEIDLVAVEGVERATYWDSVKKVAENW